MKPLIIALSLAFAVGATFARTAHAPAAAPSAPMTQKEKMAACSKANKGKKGDDFKSAQKACLSA